MDRQVLWMLKAIPELEEMEEDKELDDNRINVSYKSTLVGYRLTLFYAIFNEKIINREGRTREQLLKNTDEMYGRLTQSEEDLIQNYCKKINNVKDYYGYFKILGIPFPSKKELFEAIKKSITNSRRKGYHGLGSFMNKLPKTDIMIKEYLEEKPYPLNSLMVKGKLIDAADPIWKKAVTSRFSWTSDYVNSLTEKEALTPMTLASISDKMKTTQMQVTSYNQSRHTIMGSNFYKLLETTTYYDLDGVILKARL